jgi:hypothetical protein
MTLSLSRLRALLTGLCAVLLAVLIAEVLVPVPQWQPPTPAPLAVQAPPPLVAPAPVPPISAFAQIGEHDVFDPRRAPLKAPPSVSGGVASLGDLSLVGIILDGGTKLAMLRVRGQPQAVALSTGASIEGWQVVGIGSDRVTLRGSGGQQVLLLSANKPAAASPQPDQQL